MTTQNKQTAKVALVTGGSRGIGRSIIESLASRNVHSIFTYHRNSAEAETVVATAKKNGVEVIALQLDLSDIKAFDQFVENVKSALQILGATHFDYLVNNAGNSHNHMPFEKATEEELDSIYKVHFKGVFFLTQKLLPLINDGGRIINISTARTRIASPGGSVYASMKGALEVLSQHMARELAPRKITVNIVAPGAVATDFSGGMVRDNPQVNKLVADHTLLGRVAQANDIGTMVASLLSDENGWVNAQRIELTGGLMI